MWSAILLLTETEKKMILNKSQQAFKTVSMQNMNIEFYIQLVIETIIVGTE